MSDNGNHPDTRLAQRQPRNWGSAPILVVAVLFVAATSLAWYFSWFGRTLSDTEISQYLADEKHPRHVQHALSQIQGRMDSKDPSAKKWYPDLLRLSGSPETEFRLTVAWLMGFDNTVTEFHDALLKLLHDSEPIVRRNAALALVRFNDHSGREELVSILRPYTVQAPRDGVVASTLQEGSRVARGTLLGRIQQPDATLSEIRSPLLGRINQINKKNGEHVTAGEEILSLNSDEGSIWEALRGLSFVGEPQDIDLIRSYAASNNAVSDNTRKQAALTAGAIASRTNQTNSSTKQ
ncbi:MAG TPA: HEAT repeat domain-containing protein [Pyrinomonadaceae bacterium]|nr:HEAT repeat domain-containing protein [Pyrinomonadaceae bacterium]